MLDDETRIEFSYSRRLYPGIDVEQIRRQVRMTLRKKDEEPTSLLLKRLINNRDLRILLFHYDKVLSTDDGKRVSKWFRLTKEEKETIVRLQAMVNDVRKEDRLRFPQTSQSGLIYAVAWV